MNYILDHTDSCYIISIPSLDALVRKPFVLSCGEVLDVGDEFIKIGSKRKGQACAGFAQIILDDAWQQRMEGIFSAPFCGDVNGAVHDFVLMSARHADGRNALDGYISDYEHSFLAYTVIYDSDLHFTTGSCAGRLIKTDSIVRSNKFLQSSMVMRRLRPYQQVSLF